MEVPLQVTMHFSVSASSWQCGLKWASPPFVCLFNMVQSLLSRSKFIISKVSSPTWVHCPMQTLRWALCPVQTLRWDSLMLGNLLVITHYAHCKLSVAQRCSSMCLIVFLKWCFCVSTVILHLNLCDKLVWVCWLYCYSISWDMRCALDTLTNFFTSLYCWHSMIDRTIPSSQAQHRKITTWNYDVILLYVNAPGNMNENMGKTKNKFLGVFMIAIYNTPNSELWYANNCQHTHSYRSCESQLCHFMKLFCLRKSMCMLSLYT